MERVIWVDAICINQNDLAERKHQVELMASTYAKARSVILWLGVKADGSDQALEEIRTAIVPAEPSNGRTIQHNKPIL